MISRRTKLSEDTVVMLLNIILPQNSIEDSNRRQSSTAHHAAETTYNSELIIKNFKSESQIKSILIQEREKLIKQNRGLQKMTPVLTIASSMLADSITLIEGLIMATIKAKTIMITTSMSPSSMNDKADLNLMKTTQCKNLDKRILEIMQRLSELQFTENCGESPVVVEQKNFDNNDSLLDKRFRIDTIQYLSELCEQVMNIRASSCMTFIESEKDLLAWKNLMDSHSITLESISSKIDSSANIFESSKEFGSDSRAVLRLQFVSQILTVISSQTDELNLYRSQLQSTKMALEGKTRRLESLNEELRQCSNRIMSYETKDNGMAATQQDVTSDHGLDPRRSDEQNKSEEEDCQTKKSISDKIDSNQLCAMNLDQFEAELASCEQKLLLIQSESEELRRERLSSIQALESHVDILGRALEEKNVELDDCLMEMNDREARYREDVSKLTNQLKLAESAADQAKESSCANLDAMQTKIVSLSNELQIALAAKEVAENGKILNLEKYIYKRESYMRPVYTQWAATSVSFT